MAALELHDIQGNILNGYGFPRGMHLFCTVPDAAAGRAFLDQVRGEVIQDATPWHGKPPVVRNIALTYAGLDALAVEDAVLRELPEAFREPMRRRAERLLGDTGANAPDRWTLDTQRAHVLVLVAGSKDDDDGPLRDAVRRIQEHAAACNVKVAAHQATRGFRNEREHFGWADGFGQPAVEGAPVAPSGKARRRIGQGVPRADGITWREVKAGEFVHGYEDEDSQLLAGRSAPLLRNGTYLVYRKLEQDVEGFDKHLREEARRYRDALGRDAPPEEYVVEMLAAKIVGRWRDGLAISVAERRDPDEARQIREGGRADPDNDFRYARLDAAGHICPRGAHIRRTNPRDALVGGGSMARRHRIIRRGLAYEDADGTRGLIFMCFNADIERQFEFVQTQWCNDGNAFRLGLDRDFFAGANGDGDAGTMTIEGPVPFLLRRRQVVFTRGSEYLLMPGLDALDDIIRGRPGVARRDV